MYVNFVLYISFFSIYGYCISIRYAHKYIYYFIVHFVILSGDVLSRLPYVSLIYRRCKKKTILEEGHKKVIFIYSLYTCSTDSRFRIHIYIYTNVNLYDIYKFGKRFPFPLPINERRLKICIFRRSTFCR